MPKFDETYMDTLIEKTRQIIIMRGDRVSGTSIMKTLQQNGMQCEINLALKLKKKILTDRVKNPKNWEMKPIVAEVVNNYDAVCELCWGIMMDKSETTKNKLNALGKLIDAKKAKLNALMDSGFFTRKLGETNIVNEYQMTSELEESIKCWDMQFGERRKAVKYVEEAKIIEQTAKEINEPKPKQEIRVGTVEKPSTPSIH